ncbi:MAG TPA: vWA domain-containing protein [Pirellulales bacterium]|nr:vWA domain-containing protein [Pirellulales bacterium]
MASSKLSEWLASPTGRAFSSAGFSVLVHGTLLILLAMFTIVTAGPKVGALSLMASASAGDSSDDAASMASLQSNMRPEVNPTMKIVANGTSALRPAVDSDSMGRVQGTGSGEGNGGKGTATFFGAATAGERFIYIIDNSNSMKNGKFERACAELISSINQLTSKQSYYVIFFSDQAYPLYAPREAPVMLPAISMNILPTQLWIKDQTLHRGTRAHQAFDKAFSLKPDAIYVLTDGHFTDDTDRYLLGLKNNTIPIHGIGFGKNKDAGADSLKLITDMHHGTYTFVQVSK